MHDISNENRIIAPIPYHNIMQQTIRYYGKDLIFRRKAEKIYGSKVFQTLTAPGFQKTAVSYYISRGKDCKIDFPTLQNMSEHS